MGVACSQLWVWHVASCGCGTLVVGVACSQLWVWYISSGCGMVASCGCGTLVVGVVH